MFSENSVFDTLIIGNGLAGSMLAWQLIQHGQKIMVVGDESLPSASRVAAGLFNPVTGKRLVLQPYAETVIPAAVTLYRSLERRFGQCFFHEKPMLRIIKGRHEKETFEKRTVESDYIPYLGTILPTPALVNAPNGLFEQRKTGYLDTNSLLDCLRDYFIAQGFYHPFSFDHADLNVTSEGIEWRGFKAARIIFCEGFMAKENPWFNWLPFQPAKGEILSLKTDVKLPEKIINGGKWILPLQNGHFKTGATYDHNLSTLEPTDAGKAELIAGMQKLLTSPIEYSLLDHRAGVRPNTLDKHPFIGLHPVRPEIGIFNGFGSKGSMLIPFYSAAFADCLSKGLPLPPEADISRIAYG
ncbi:NAD(P)/FAD-dependent oxidoreductase [Mariprofundus ferrinatatus]|nr:FAD-dependent oxidoreductase [Mariprofundus ferrinatatus]